MSTMKTQTAAVGVGEEALCCAHELTTDMQHSLSEFASPMEHCETLVKW